MEIQKSDVRFGIEDLQKTIESIPEALGKDPFPLEHTFGDGTYIRKITMPKGFFVISEIHKITHPYFMLRGDVSVLTENGVVRMKAPCHGITQRGTKRVGYIHEEVEWADVFPTDEKDLKKLRSMIVAESYDELPDCDIPSINISEDDFEKFMDDMVCQDEFDVIRFRSLTKEVFENEKPGFWSDWTEKEQYEFTDGTWEEFSKLRGYTKEQIIQFGFWIEMISDAIKKGVNPFSFIEDISNKKAIENMCLDTKGEMLVSSFFLNKNWMQRLRDMPTQEKKIL